MTNAATVEIKIGIDQVQLKPGLEKVQSEITSAFANISKAISSSYGEVQEKVTSLTKEIKAGAGGAALGSDFSQARKESVNLKDSLASQQRQLQQNRSSMTALGASSSDLSRKQVGLRKEVDATRTSFLSLSAIKLGVAGLMIGGAYYANEVRKIADEYTNLNSRLKLVTDSEQELTTVREKLYRISQETGTEYAGNADSYAKLARAVKDLGGSSEETLRITELVNKSLIVNGSSSEMASSFMLQFAQALGSGVLQGDEFRAMLESNSFFASELAKALNTNIAGLRQMSKDGELTAGTLRTAFPKMAQAINSEFSKISPTVERAMTMLENSFKRIVDESNRASGGTKSISQSIIDLAATIDRNRDGIISLFTRLIDGAAWTTKQVAGIGTEMEVLGQVAKGNLGFFDYIKMTSVEEMHDWLVKNVQTLNETGPAAQKAGDEISKAAQKSADTQKQVTGEALKEMKKQYQDYAKEVKKLQGELADNQRSVQEELRDMTRSGMSDIDAWRDRKQEADEFTKKAKEAAEAAKKLFTSGNTEAGKETYKVAIDYADKAKTAYKGLNEEVKSGDRVVISSAQALQTAMAGVKAAGELKSEFITQQIQALTLAQAKLDAQSGGKLNESIDQTKTKATELATAADTAKTKIQELFQLEPPEDGNWGKVWEAMESGSKQAAGTVTSDWDKVWDAWLASGSDDIGRLEKQLSELIKDRTMTVRIKTVEEKSTGGIIHGYHLGGMIRSSWSGVKQALATGGGVRNILAGGHLPGFGGGDTVPLWGEAGEYMINKWASLKAGLPALQHLNAGNIGAAIAELTKRLKTSFGYRLGGMVQSVAMAGPQRLATGGGVTGGGDLGTLTLTFPSGASIPVQTSRQLARQMLREFEQMGFRASA